MRSVNSAKARATVSSPERRDRRHRLGLGCDDTLPGVGSIRHAHERHRLGEGGVDDLRVVPPAAAPAERLGRRLEIARVGDGDEVVSDADDAKRIARSAPPPRSAGTPLPSQRAVTWPERAGHLVGQVKARGEDPPAFAEARGRDLELLLAADQLLGDEAGALRWRSVVGQRRTR